MTVSRTQVQIHRVHNLIVPTQVKCPHHGLQVQSGKQGEDGVDHGAH